MFDPSTTQDDYFKTNEVATGAQRDDKQAIANGEQESRGKKRSREDRKEARRLKKIRKAGKAEDNASVEREATIASLVPGDQDHVGTRLEELGPKTGAFLDAAPSKKNSKIEKTGFKDEDEGYRENADLAALSEQDIDNYRLEKGISVSDPLSATLLRPITKFSYLPSAVANVDTSFAAFEAPTPIQAVSWPFLFSGRDVIGVAETGSGKTLAFGLPLIHSIASQKKRPSSRATVKAVIVSPTRELAIQIHAQIEDLARPSGTRSVCVYGGVSKDDQRRSLISSEIVVATPGRLNDFIQEGSADLSNVHYLVLDEADRMLDKGFEEEVRKIISSSLSNGRQTLMFTATWPQSVRDLATNFMRSPVHISIGIDNPTGELRANKSIKQVVEVIDPATKQTRLVQLLKTHQHSQNKSSNRILIFTLYKKEAARIDAFLRSRGFSVAAIHGDMSQSARSASLEGFKSGDCPLLVATDVAARGLDIPAVQLVINLTFPLTVEDYVHRIGRTGRAGKSGLAVTLFTEHDKALAGGLINVLKGAGQDVPESLLRFGTTVKKKGHEAYGAFYRDVGAGEKKQGTKIRF